MDNKIKEILDRFNFIKKEPNKLSYYPEDLLSREEMWLLLDYFTKLQQKNEELECDLEELTYSYNELQKELQNKKKQCDNLIDYVNPYHYYGLNENDFH